MGYLLQVVLLSTVVLFAVAQNMSHLTELHKVDWCGKRADYIMGECECPAEHPEGDPYFYCIDPATTTPCVYCNDPVVKTEAGQSVLLHHVGVVLFYQTEIDLRQGVIQLCLKLYIVTYRIWGKIYARCVWLVVTVKKNGIPFCKYRYKILFWFWWRIRVPTLPRQADVNYHVTYSRASSDVVDDFEELGTIRSEDRTGHTLSHLMCNYCHIKFEMPKDRRYLTVTSDNCFANLTILMRPHVIQSEWLKSGVAVLIPNEHIQPWGGNIPSVWYDQPICLNTDARLGDIQTALGLGSHQEAISYIALTQNSTDVDEFTESQQEMAKAIRSCNASERALFMDKSEFIRGWAPFIRCISKDADDDKSLEKVKNALEKAAKWFCKKVVEACRSLMNEILDKCSDLLGLGKHPKLDEFVTRNCSIVEP